MGNISRRAFLLSAAGTSAGIAIGWAPAQAAAASTAAKKLYSYGHSFAMDDYPYIPDPRHGEYARIVARKLGVPVYMRARSNTRLLDTVTGMTAPTWAGNSSRLWTPLPTNGNSAVLLHNVHNDCAAQDGGLAAYQHGYDLALRLALGVLGSRGYVPARQNIYATKGKWTSYATRYVRDASMMYTKTFGAKINFVVSGDTCHVATIASAVGNLAGEMRAEVNGKVLGYYNGYGKMSVYTDSVDGTTQHRWSNAGWRIKGMNTAAGTSGSKVLTLRKTDNTTRPVWVNAVYLTSGAPPQVYVGLEPPRNPKATSQAAVAAFYQNDPAYRALITKACNEYSYAYVVDLAPGWDNTTMVADVDPHKFHPNDAGMALLAQHFLSALH